MSMNSGGETAKREDFLSVPYKGTVKDVADPLRIGRVRCDISGIYDEIPLEKRPWIHPLLPAGLGASVDGLSWFSVPQVDTDIVVIFPYKDIYFPFYIGLWPSSETVNTEFNTLEDYPYVYGWRDLVGNQMKVNMKQGDVEFKHFTGTTIRIENNGDVLISSVNHIKLNGPGTGVITEESICPYTRAPHIDGSKTVFAGHE